MIDRDDAPRRVAVVGVGAITAMGATAVDLWDGVRAGRVAIGEVAHLCMDGYSTKLAGEVRQLRVPEHTDPGLEGFRDRVFDLALVAAREAMAAAGALRTHVPAEQWGIVIGTCNAGLLSFERWHEELRAGLDPDPRLLLRVPPQALAEAIGSAFCLRGPAMSINTACASGANAIGRAAELIRRGRADAMLAGGADALSDVVLGGFNSLGSLSPHPASPYARHRQGLSLGEGSGMLVLVAYEVADELGLPVLAEVAGYGLSADGHHPTAPHPEGEGAARAIEAALLDAGEPAASVRYVNGHGTGTAKNDPAETRAIRRALREAADGVAVSSTKSMIGHLLGAAGAVEGIVTVQALRHQVAPPTANYTEADPACDLDYVPTTARPHAMGTAISNNFAFGGANACIVLRAAGSVTGRRDIPVREPVVITGIAGFTPAGDLARAWARAGSDASAAEIATVEDDFVQHTPLRQRRRLDRFGLLTVAAAKLALLDAQLELTDDIRARTGVLVGTAIGPMESMESFMRPLLEEGPAAASPAVFPNTVFNAAAGHVGVLLGTLGPTSTITTGHAAGLAAMTYGTDLVGDGRADTIVCVAADALTETVARAYRDLGSVRRGLRVSEASVALVLERASCAQARGAVPLATVLGHGTATDGIGLGRWDRHGHGVERAVIAALDDAGVCAGDIGMVWPHACGVRRVDQPERAALRRLFPERVTTVEPKRALGEAMGASGLLNVALALTSRRAGGHEPGGDLALFINSSLGGTHVAAIVRLERANIERSAA